MVKTQISEYELIKITHYCITTININLICFAWEVKEQCWPRGLSERL